MAIVQLSTGRGCMLLLALGLVWGATEGHALQQRFDLEDRQSVQPGTAPAEALWPVPSRAQWGQVVTRKGSNVWQDAIFTDPEGRWQIVYPATLTEPGGDALGRDRWFSYPGQPQILCGALLTRGAFRGLGDNAIAEAPGALLRDPDAYVGMVRHNDYPVLNQRIVSLESPADASGQPVQAVSFDQRGKIFDLMGIEREVVVRNVLVSDGVDLLTVFCAAQPGQKKWVEKQALAALRLTTAARLPR